MFNELRETDLEKIADLRNQGETPSRIARALALRPADVREAIRQLAIQEHAATSALDRADDVRLDLPPIQKILLNANWTSGLSGPEVDEFRSAHPELEIPDSKSSLPEGGLIQIIGSRGDRRHLLSSLLLIDPWCLGVKDVMAPVEVSASRFQKLADRLGRVFRSTPVEVPLVLARKIVYGAAAYGSKLGFRPAPGFEEAASFFGPPVNESEVGISFGRNGKPTFIGGPYDDVDRILRKLEKAVGHGNFEFVAPLW